MAGHVPYVSPDRSLPEITVKGVILGVILSVVLGAANTYLGLRVGLTVSASIPAAVISMALLALMAKVFKTKHNILENNAVQTAASAGESLAAGVLFTIPALLMLNYWAEVHYWETTLVALAGGILGVLFSVPLRRALIVEAQLTFPEGIATSSVLQAGDAVGSHKAGGGIGALVLGAGIGMAYKFAESGMRLWHAVAEFAVRLRGNGIAAFGMDLAPALLAVGYIIRLRIATLVFAGGVAGWLVAIPLYSMFANDTTVVLSGQTVDWGALLDDPEGALGAAGVLWSARIRYIGVGAMLVGGLWSLVKLRKPLGQALAQGLRGGATQPTDVPRTEREIGTRATFLGVLGMVIPIFLLYWYITRSLGLWHSLGVASLMALVMVVTGFLFSAVGAYMAGLVGASNNPISGVTILTVIAAALTLLALGVPSDLGPAATILVAAIIACAGALSSDNMQDLKAGYLLGATPKKQQTMQIIGVSAAAFALAPVLQLLHDAYVIGSPELAAPQAGLMAAVAGFIFEGGLPTSMVAIGAGLAVLLIIIDEIQEKRGSAFRTPVMPVAVGIYLPVGLTSPIFLGGLVAFVAQRILQKRGDDVENGLRGGVLFASGAIAGEALIGIAIALVAAAGLRERISLSDGSLVWPGLLLMGYIAVVLGHIATRKARA